MMALRWCRWQASASRMMGVLMASRVRPESISARSLERAMGFVRRQRMVMRIAAVVEAELVILHSIALVGDASLIRDFAYSSVQTSFGVPLQLESWM